MPWQIEPLDNLGSGGRQSELRPEVRGTGEMLASMKTSSELAVPLKAMTSPRPVTLQMPYCWGSSMSWPMSASLNHCLYSWLFWALKDHNGAKESRSVLDWYVGLRRSSEVKLRRFEALHCVTLEIRRSSEVKVRWFEAFHYINWGNWSKQAERSHSRDERWAWQCTSLQYKSEETYLKCKSLKLTVAVSCNSPARRSSRFEVLPTSSCLKEYT